MKFSYISGNGNPKKNFQAQKIKKIPAEKIFYILGYGIPKQFFYVFSKESFSYISGNGNPKTFQVRKTKKKHS